MIAATDANRLDELETDNKRLRRLLDLRDAPGELRHLSRSTMSLMRSIVRLSSQTARSLPDYVAQLEDRLDALARVQGFVNQHGYVDLRTLIAEELFQYGAAEGDRLTLSGPDIRLHPKAGQILALALHELAVNAVEHGALGVAGGHVEISWSIGPDQSPPSTSTSKPLSLSWKERGAVTYRAPPGSGFGTEVLTRLLAYELEAKSTLTFEADGLRFDLSVPVPLLGTDATPG